MNRTYYGEYSLKYWIDLMIYKKIELPEYQRSFVWDAQKVKDFYNSLREGFFIPPVTIGYHNLDEKSHNFIIDGQQRLTSILLGVIGRFPLPEKFKFVNEMKFANDNDDEIDVDEELLIEWTYEKLLESDNLNGNSIDLIRNKINDDERYGKLDLGFTVDNDFLKKHFIGFSYYIPDSASIENAQYYFSNTFKIINTAGKPLLPMEARKSLYFLKEGLERFFSPDFSKQIYCDSGSGKEYIDFTRYLALTFEFDYKQSTASLAKGFARKLEDYYQRFILAIVNSVTEEKGFAKYDLQKTDETMKRIRNNLEKVKLLNKTFPSIIDADVYLFGLIYFSIFKEKEISDSFEFNKYEQKLREETETIKRDPKHKKSPAAFKYLRSRLARSYDLYKEMLDEQT